MKDIRFGIIGAGLMGREFASAAARWFHLSDMPARPVITAVCDKNPAILDWYRTHLPGVTQLTEDYQVLLADPSVDAVYVAVPHNLHAEIYTAVLEAGKHLMGEKPFGIDQAANRAILETVRKHPDILVRCSSEFPFCPAMQRLTRMIEDQRFGRLLEVNGAFLHSSDLDPDKPINWKRMIEFNGEYGVMGDLGMHVCHVPFRAGWIPRNVRAILSDIIKERPDGKGNKVPCRTWENATLLCEATHPDDGETFPLTLKTQRIAPGEKNSWCLEILGTQSGARFSTRNINHLEIFERRDGEQMWHHLDMGHETTFPTITGGIFEFGFSDAILQMWAAFISELAGVTLRRFASCVTPDETAISHALFTAALRSQARGTTEQLETEE